MPRTPTITDHTALTALKELVKKKSNLKCASFPAIQQLHLSILKETGASISVQTLARLLGLVRADFNPSLQTLNILSKYVHYASFDEFQQHTHQEMPGKSGESEFIGDFFHKMFSGSGRFNENCNYLLLKNIFSWMETAPQFSAEIYTGVAITPYGRRIFFRDFVDIDAFNRGFGIGVHYCLLHTESGEEKLLGYSLNCLRYYLNGDKTRFSSCFKSIEQCRQEDIISCHPVVIDRFYAAIVLNQAMSAAPSYIPKESDLPDLNMLMSVSLSMSNSCFHVGEAFLLTGDFIRAGKIFESLHVKDLQIPDYLRDDYQVQLTIYKMVCGFFAGYYPRKKILMMADEPVLQQLPFLQKDYLTIFLVNLKYNLTSDPGTKTGLQEKLKRLIEKTGFAHFRYMMKC